MFGHRHRPLVFANLPAFRVKGEILKYKHPERHRILDSYFGIFCNIGLVGHSQGTIIVPFGTIFSGTGV